MPSGGHGACCGSVISRAKVSEEVRLKGLWAMTAMSPVPELPMPPLAEWAWGVGEGTGHPASVVWARTGLESPAGPALCLRCLHSITDPT